MSDIGLHQRSWKETVAYLLAWIGSTVFAILDLWIVGGAIVQATIWFGAHRSEASRQSDLLTGASFGWTVELVSQITLLVLVCVGLGLTIGLEYYYRQGADKGKLAQRFIKVTRSELIVAGIGLAVLLLTYFV